MTSKIPHLATVCCVLLISTLAAFAEPADSETNWPSWRGPNSDGYAATTQVPARWEAKNILWKAQLPGKGHSTPVVWNQRIFLTAPVQGQDAVLAFDRVGKPLWQTVIGPERPGKHADSSGCNPSPVTDGQSLFAYFKSGAFAGLDLDGKIRWQTNIQERFGKDTLFWDISSSPVLTEKNVVLAVLQQDTGFLAAFDKLTGELRWKVDRSFKASRETDQGYATPLVIRHEGKEALLVWGAEHLTLHDAADGSLLWSCGDFNTEKKGGWASIVTPVIAQNIAIISDGRGSRLHGIKVEGSGDVTATHHVWKRQDSGSFIPTPAVSKEGLVYLLRDEKPNGGIVECIDPLTGAPHWSGRLPEDGSKFFASPVIVGDQLLITRLDGTVFVLRAGGPFEILAQNATGERIIASPVPFRGGLLLRGEQHLFCIGAAEVK